MDKLLEEFLVESHENLDQLDQDLVALEEDPANRELLSCIFRTMHTLKGSCGFLGFTTLESVAHVGENLLSRLRAGELQLNAEIATALLALVDAVRQILVSIEMTGQEGETDYAYLVETLTRLQQGGGADLRHGTHATVLEKPPVATARNGEEDTTSTRSHIAPPQGQRGERPHGDMQHRVEAFLVESYAHLDRLDQELVMLQEGSADSETLARVWHGLQTLTDSCGTFGFTRLALLTHGGANMMRRLCDGELQLNVEITTVLRTLVDAVYQMLSNIEVMGREGETDDTHLLATFTRFEDVSAVPPAPPPLLERPRTPLPTTAQPQSVVAAQARATSVSDTSIRVDVGLLDALMDQVGELVLVRNRLMQCATLQEDRGIV